MSTYTNDLKLQPEHNHTHTCTHTRTPMWWLHLSSFRSFFILFIMAESLIMLIYNCSVDLLCHFHSISVHALIVFFLPHAFCLHLFPSLSCIFISLCLYFALSISNSLSFFHVLSPSLSLSLSLSSCLTLSDLSSHIKKSWLRLIYSAVRFIGMTNGRFCAFQNLELVLVRNFLK